MAPLGKVRNLTDGQLADVPVCQGFAYVRRPTKARNGVVRFIDANRTADDYSARVLALIEWAKKHRFGIQPGGREWQYMTVHGRNRELLLPNTFKVHANKPALRREQTQGFCQCGVKVVAGMVECRACGARPTCGLCGGHGWPYAEKPMAGETGICTDCAVPCSHAGCSNKTYPAAAPNKPRCREHNPVHRCWNPGCQREYRESRMHATDEWGHPGYLCGRCVGYFCRHHQGLSHAPIQTGVGVSERKCVSCQLNEKLKGIKLDTPFSPDALPANGSLVIPSLPERPFRTVSVEMEYDSPGGNAQTVAQILYNEGLIASPQIGRYSSQGSRDDKHPCMLKQDGSVNGGELVAYMMNLDDEGHAAAFLRVLEVMDVLRQAGMVKFSTNAGGHIHHDAHNFSVGDAWALVTLFNYLEDPIHRIAGAGTPQGHRSLAGNNHGSAEVLKGPFGGRKSFGMNMPRFARAALNIQHFVRAMNECRCGAAQYEAWSECTCVLPKNTIEWRVFNATGDPRILHGWIAFMQSLVAFSTAMEVNEADYPALRWSRTPFKNLNAPQKDAVWTRLEWIFTHLPMTAEEKNSLTYALTQSDMIDYGEERLRTLMALPPVVEFDAKPQPRNPNARKIVIKKPDPKKAVPFG